MSAPRRTVLAAAGFTAAALTVPGCGASGGSADEEATGSGSPSPRTPDCALSPEATEGPFYRDLKLVRRDITEGRPGVPLRLRCTVLDTATCEPLPEASVDIWHADAEGVYSGFEEGRGARFLRGVQVTDRAGTATFETIVPGWYTNRTMHIHIKVHVGGDTVHTGQLYFDEELAEAVTGAQPYAQRQDPRTGNADDSLFAQGGDQSVLKTTGSVRTGYQAAISLGVRS
ncbi:intradiol ring-cleavage dioxygenase [Streptomyces apocyni]|uniref:intradiol ring-cleavage dioxygenase n=1 Tax=Streptomyces apocyni TaxID=2654677 RepID=UPI0012E9D279|nr:intradiol ring-cleavage dioxygenase [Streptomyces apocyni]